MTTPNEDLIDRLYDWHNTSAEQNRLDMQKAADLLQSQAERIKVIERESEMRRIALHDVMLESDQLRAQLADAELHTKQVERGLDKATAQLAEIEKTEPVAYMVQFSPGSRWIELTKEEFDSDLDGHIVYKKQAFFTHPMPAQRLTELKLLMLTTAYEQGVGKGIQRRDCNLYAADTDEHAAWKLGYEEGLDKPMPAQGMTELVDALEMIVSTHQGHCEHHVGVSKHSYNLADIAEEALSKYKGAK